MRLHLTRRDAMTGAVASAAVSALPGVTHAASEPVVHEIEIRRFAFVPDHLRVAVGDVIRWTNADLAPHTATAKEFGWDTEEIVKGAHGEITVTAGMETRYFCVFHPHMTGSLEIA